MSEIIVFRPELRVSEACVDAWVHSQRVTEQPSGWFRSPRDAWLAALDRLLELSNECQRRAGEIRHMVEKNY